MLSCLELVPVTRTGIKVPTRCDLGGRRSVTMLAALLTCATLFGQSGPPAGRLRTFHIHGAVRKYDGSVVPGTRVRFNGDKFKKTVFTDETGSYEADLPLGLYTMTADALKPVDFNFGLNSVSQPPQGPYQPDVQRYERPLFRVTSQARLTLDVTLDPAAFCERGVPRAGSLPTSGDGEITCGGQDSFRIPSSQGVPFELLIRFWNRRTTEQGYAYNTRNVLPNLPVFAAYNLFTLRADHVVYDVKRRTLQATGNVVTVDADGATRRADSMTLAIENGRATPVH